MSGSLAIIYRKGGSLTLYNAASWITSEIARASILNWVPLISHAQSIIPNMHDSTIYSNRTSPALAMYVTIVQYRLQALNKKYNVFWLLVAEWWLNTINTSTINESYRYYTCPYKLTCPATLDQLASWFSLSCHAWSRVHAFYVLILWQYWHSYSHHTLHAISTPTQYNLSNYVCFQVVQGCARLW